MNKPTHFSATFIFFSLFALVLASCDSCTSTTAPTTGTPPTTKAEEPESSPCPPIDKGTFLANCTTAGVVRNCSFTWDAVQGVSAYELTLKELVNGTWNAVKTDTVQTNSHQLSNLSGSSQYKLAIKCLCPGGAESIVIDDLAIK
jgi:hypothetical protein